jgi:hypothetical protein
MPSNSESRLLAVCFAFAVAVLGCAAPYKEPSGRPTASIEFVDDASDPLSLHFHAGAKECTNRTTAPPVAPRSRRTITVVAGEPVVFTAGMDPGGKAKSAFGLAAAGFVNVPIYRGCTPTIEFVPRAGGVYIFRIASDGTDCTYSFLARSTGTNQAAVTPISFNQRAWMRAVTEAGPWCAPRS